jgi:hypothetical protein
MMPLKIVASALLTYAVCLAAGQLLLTWLKIRLWRAERWSLGFVLGSACLSTLVFFLAALRWIYPWVLVMAAGAILLTWLLLCSRSPGEPTPPPYLSLPWQLAFWLPYLAFGIFYVGTAMLPETSSDGMAYHVGLITRYYARHGFYPIRTDMYANFPQGIEMLFLYAYAFGRHSAAALVHLLYLLTLPFGILAYARRMGQPAIGVVASLLFYVTPVVGMDATSAYNDVATAAVVFGCFYFLQLWLNDRRLPVLVPAGLLAGFSFACKYTAGSIIAYAIVFLLFSELFRHRQPWRPIATVAITAIIMAAPWVLKNIAYVGNPFFPFFNQLFSNPYFYDVVEREYRSQMAHMNGVAYLAIPWQVTVGGQLIGIVGPVFLLAPLALLSLRFSIGREVLPAFLAVLLPYFGNIGTRFLIVPLPFLALALAAGLSVIPRLPIMVVALHVILSWPSLIPAWAPPPYRWFLTTFEWRAALRITSQEQYLQSRLGSRYGAGLMLDHFVPADRLVYSPSLDQLAYHHRDLLGFWQSSLGHRMYSMFVMAVNNDQAPLCTRQLSFQTVRTNVVRLVLEDRSDEDLKLSEVRFFAGTQELPRQRQWRLTSSDNPWEVQLAFDNSPVSWWSSGRRGERGIWLQVDFGASREITRIAVEQPSSQRWLHLQLQILPRTVGPSSHPRGTRRCAAGSRPAEGCCRRDEGQWN